VTFGLGNRCSIQLSYGTVSKFPYVYERFRSMCVGLLYGTYRETLVRIVTKSGTGGTVMFASRSCCRGSELDHTLFGLGEVLQVAFGHLDTAVPQALLQAVD
jgi:hypothetical protein